MDTSTKELIIQKHIQIEKEPMLIALKISGVLQKDEWQNLMEFREKPFCFI